VRILAKNEVPLRPGITVLVVLAVAASSPRLLAQASSEITHPAADPTHNLTTKEFAKDILLNFRGLFSLGNAKLLAAGGVLTGLSVIPEENTENYFDREGPWGAWTKPGKYIGNSAVVGGASALLFAVSRGSHDQRFRSFAYAAVQGMIVNESLVQATKLVVHRERPNHQDNRAFPSGHAATSFMFATLLAGHYGWKAGVPGYLVASYVATTRLSDSKHHLSDVVAGAVIGGIVGHTVTRSMKRHPDSRVSWWVTPVKGGFLGSLSIGL
jgi:membrane-associated phospholipid phosphatase